MGSRGLAVTPNDRPYTETEYNEPLPRNPLRSRKIPAPVANTDIRKYVSASRDLLAADGWISKPEIPTSEEVMGIAVADGSDVINLMPNQVEGPWQSRETYLRAHYELLREESVALLRDAVAYVRDDPRMDDTQEVCIYDKVCHCRKTLGIFHR
jgi:helicase required for RNAi-mediated heterochromatin assembly 1